MAFTHALQPPPVPLSAAPLVANEQEGALEDWLSEAVRDRLRREWPFRSAAFPGRTFGWSEWDGTPDERR